MRKLEQSRGSSGSLKVYHHHYSSTQILLLRSNFSSNLIKIKNGTVVNRYKNTVRRECFESINSSDNILITRHTTRSFDTHKTQQKDPN